MYRLSLATVLVALVLSGCGGDSGSDKSGTPSAEERKARDASYFATAETRAINTAAAAAQTAGAKAASTAHTAACSKIKEYAAWRTCWHGLLDPFFSGLAGLSGVFRSLSTRNFPEDCAIQIKRAAQTFTAFAGRVDALLGGIDSDQRAAQVKAARSYQATVDGITEGYNEPFRNLTQVCYSPEDLASINASPTPRP
jgi:hypothetical protein